MARSRILPILLTYAVTLTAGLGSRVVCACDDPCADAEAAAGALDVVAETTERGASASASADEDPCACERVDAVSMAANRDAPSGPERGCDDGCGDLCCVKGPLHAASASPLLDGALLPSAPIAVPDDRAALRRPAPRTPPPRI